MIALIALCASSARRSRCGEAMELLHLYADLSALDPAAAASRHPGVAAHLRACGPCEDDLIGLLAAIDAAGS